MESSGCTRRDQTCSSATRTPRKLEQQNLGYCVLYRYQYGTPKSVSQLHCIGYCAVVALKTMTTLFQNARQVAHYASYRPTYPAALFDRIAAATAAKTAAADIGCGTGQATHRLVNIFDQVTGLDPSETQIQAARQAHPETDFVVGRESQLPFPDSSLDCITSAQAAHWFDLPAFYAQVDRVLKPKGGVLAIWCYGMPRFAQHPELQRAVNHDLYETVLGPYWDERRRIVEHLYKDLETIDKLYKDYKTERIQDETLNIERNVSGSEIIGYLRSWSGYVKYCKAQAIEEGSDKDPLNPIEKLLVNQDNPILMVSPVCLLLSRKS